MTKEISVIPQPDSVVFGRGNFVLNNETVIVADNEAVETATFLQDFLVKATGIKYEIVPKAKKNAIVFSIEQGLQ
jgi:hypothetical protein